MTKVEEIREASGIAMGSRAHGHWIGWTTDAEKMEKAKAAGAMCKQIGPPEYTITGWDISCLVEAT